MDSETIYQPSPHVDPSPPTTPASFTPKRPPQLLYILGGVAVILFSIALAISFFGKGKITKPSSTGSSSTTASDTTSNWPKYTNIPFFYEIAIPPKWTEIKHSPLRQDIALFNADSTATLEITALKTTSTLDDYLSAQDEANKSIDKSNSSTQVKVGDYDGFERAESWPVVGLQAITTYIKVSDMLYTFTLAPAGGASAVTNDSIIRAYHATLSSFRLTDTSKLGLDLKDYTSKKITGLSFEAFSLKYPQTWVLTEKVGDNSLDISIYRNNYELTISQKAIGTSVCLFSDSPAFEGSSGDLRNKQFAEFNTSSGTILRRYFNANLGDKSSMFFCEKQKDGPYFQTPLSIGGLVYNVPAKYDADIIKEMDGIVKTITPVEASASASIK